MSKKKKKGFNRKAFLFALAAVLLIGCSVGGTLAWLTAETDAVKNTFTVGDINITLAETEREYKMVPGCTIDKDPKVTVKAGSEACWLFVKIEESENLDDFITYTVVTGENGWTALEGVDGVYYRKVEAVTADTGFDILADNQVTVKDTVTKKMMGELTENTQPTLTFTAYASQLYKSNGVEFTAAEAWATVPKS